MHGFSTVDGFMEINESLADMIKYLANEPSVGLFYIQQHTHNSVPNLVSLRNKVEEKSHETTLHTEDLEDSIAMVRSMKDCGVLIADDMIRDIKKSLDIMSRKQPKRGLIKNSNLGFHMGRTSSWGPTTWGANAQPSGERSGNYFSTVLKSAKQKASNIKWPQFDSRESGEMNKGTNQASVNLNLANEETEELPLSSRVSDELLEEEDAPNDEGLNHNMPLLADNYDEFRASKEARLEEWLKGTGNLNDRTVSR